MLTAHEMIEIIRDGYRRSVDLGGRPVHAIAGQNGVRFVEVMTERDTVIVSDIRAPVFSSIAEGKELAAIYRALEPMRDDLDRISAMILTGPDGKPRANTAEFIEGLVCMLVGPGSPWRHEAPAEQSQFTKLWRRIWCIS